MRRQPTPGLSILPVKAVVRARRRGWPKMAGRAVSSRPWSAAAAHPAASPWRAPLC